MSVVETKARKTFCPCVGTPTSRSEGVWSSISPWRRRVVRAPPGAPRRGRGGFLSSAEGRPSVWWGVGCGKSTTEGRSWPSTSPPGEVLFDGVNVAALSEEQFKPYRRRMQLIFQDPYASLILA